MQRNGKAAGRSTATTPPKQLEFSENICTMCGEDLDNNEEVAKARCRVCGDHMYHKVCLDPWRLAHSPPNHKYKHWGYQCARGQGANPFGDPPCKLKVAATFYMPRWKSSRPGKGQDGSPAATGTTPQQDQDADVDHAEADEASVQGSASDSSSTQDESETSAATPVVLPDEMELRPLKKADDDLDSMYAVRQIRVIRAAVQPAAAAAEETRLAAAAAEVTQPAADSDSASHSWEEHYLGTRAPRENAWQVVQRRPAAGVLKQQAHNAAANKHAAAAKPKKIKAKAANKKPAAGPAAAHKAARGNTQPASGKAAAAGAAGVGKPATAEHPAPATGQATTTHVATSSTPGCSTLPTTAATNALVVPSPPTPTTPAMAVPSQPTPALAGTAPSAASRTVAPGHTVVPGHIAVPGHTAVLAAPAPGTAGTSITGSTLATHNAATAAPPATAPAAVTVVRLGPAADAQAFKALQPEPPTPATMGFDPFGYNGIFGSKFAQSFASYSTPAERQWEGVSNPLPAAVPVYRKEALPAALPLCNKETLPGSAASTGLLNHLVAPVKANQQPVKAFQQPVVCIPVHAALPQNGKQHNADTVVVKCTAPAQAKTMQAPARVNKHASSEGTSLVDELMLLLLD